ncbi:peptide deformylase [Patescibacteria group bacterium]|nr:peptide deformylase [Patescibacteria group bacterium]MBU1951517.1 peptide deformylase [Patescibacteria group bacterium]
MKYEIITEGNPILRKKSDTIKNPMDSDVQEFIPDLVKMMLEEDGIGIAAPQVGKSIQMIIVNQKDGPLVLINPKVKSKSMRTEIAEEGCLSVPGIFGLVKRSKKAKVEALDKNGKSVTIKAEGLFARVLLHEIDHLNGILFIDKVIKKTRDTELENNVL